MQKFTVGLILILAITAAFSFDNKPKEKVNWISFAELEKMYAENPKPILVDLYTSWCGWCKEMDRTTYSNVKVAAYINEHYYAVKYNAESKDSVAFNKIKYGFNKAAKTNDLALYLSFGERSYPNTIFLENLHARPAPLSGYMKPKEMEAPLKYFVEKKGEETFVEFNRKMKTEW
jgi:thioredoxin-related protein